ncbi:MAG: methyltransferase domain-containing protein [Patescibacteria group bacterium]|nr:class I SAM-dependent methyltransferase [Patescibacteria group bacterium]MBU1877301.1 class I SAM-dependent methyltransferase [Patescibacteria group bacterium]
MKKEYAQFLLEKTTDDYNLIASDFSRTREFAWPEIDFLFEKLLEKGDVVLDLGCGNGRWLESFKKREVEYFGLDNSEELIKIAQTKYPDTNFIKANALNLPFSDDYFDKVYSIAVFHQIPSEEFRLRFLKEVKRVLKPGGLLILTVWKFHQKKTIFSLLKYTILKLLQKSELDLGDVLYDWGDQTKRYYHIFSQKELVNLLEKSEFEVQDISIIKNKEGNRRNIYLIAKKSL